MIVLIDEPERNLQITSQCSLAENLLTLPHVKKVIVATHSPIIIHDSAACVEIEQCILN